MTGAWRMRQLYDVAYFPIVVTRVAARRVRPAATREALDQNEGHERRYFYGSVWAVCIAQPILWFLWRALPQVDVL